MSADTAAATHFPPDAGRPHPGRMVASLGVFAALCVALLCECAHSVALDHFSRVRRAEDDGLDALLAAVERGQSKRVAALLNRGVDVEGRDVADRTPLMCAALFGRAEVCSVLIDRGADLHASSCEGWNALMYAVLASDERVVRLLLSRDAAVDAPTPSGQTALMVACGRGDCRLATVLIRAGADVNATARNGITPLIHATAAAGDDEMPALVRLLVDAGADVNAIDREGATALTEAQGRGSPATLELLQSAGAASRPPRVDEAGGSQQSVP